MEPEQKLDGALIGSFIIVIILILGGIYLWRSMVRERSVPVDSNLSLSYISPIKS